MVRHQNGLEHAVAHSGVVHGHVEPDQVLHLAAVDGRLLILEGPGQVLAHRLLVGGRVAAQTLGAVQHKDDHTAFAHRPVA